MTEPRDPQPLSAGEERDARRGWRVPQERWIATLDAARSTDGLREALALLDRFDDAATDYINAVVAISDPTIDPHTEATIREARSKALDALLGVIGDHRAARAALASPKPAPHAHIEGESAWECFVDHAEGADE